MKFVIIVLTLLSYSSLYDAAQNFTYIVHNTTCRNVLDRVNGSRLLVYPDNTLHPVSVPYMLGPSAQIVGEVAYILLSEVMGYSTVLFDQGTIFSASMINYVAGCLDPNDLSCVQRDVNDPKVHFSIETWPNGMIRAEQSLPPDVRPTLVSVLDYNLQDSIFIWRETLELGASTPQRIWLDDYRSYDARYYKPHQFFDPWTKMMEVLPPEYYVPCSTIFSQHAQQSIFTDNYFKLSNDTASHCIANDTVWITPACRSNLTGCVPLFMQYSFDFAMQIAYFLNMPLAIVMVNYDKDPDLVRYYAALRKGSFLFHVYTPDDRLVDDNGNLPVQLSFPKQNSREQLQGIYRTGRDDVRPRSYAWNQLKSIDSFVNYFISKVDFESDDMDDMMQASHELKSEGLDSISTARQVACDWVRDNEGTWRSWIPAICPDKYFTDSSMTVCTPCEAGTFCTKGISKVCPMGFYCPSNSSEPISCDGNRNTKASGAKTPEDCSDCMPGFVMSAGYCLAYWLLLPIGIIPLLVLFAIFHNWSKHSLNIDELNVHDKILELRSKIGIRPTDGYILSNERVPWWRKIDEFTVVPVIHIKAAALLALGREDFDTKHVDGFCHCFHEETVQHAHLCSWVLEISKILLDPDHCPSDSEFSNHIIGFRPSMRPAYRPSFSIKIAPYSDQMDSALSRLPPELRFRFFQRKLASLQIWRENSKNLFGQLKEIVDDYMRRIGKSCLERYKSLLSDPSGQELQCLHKDDRWARLSSGDYAKWPSELVHVETRTSALDLDEAALKQFWSTVFDSSQQESARQDNQEVGAIRVCEADRQEAQLQTHHALTYRAKRGSKDRTPMLTLVLDEDSFLAQLALRSKLLNDGFHDKVLEVIFGHSKDKEQRETRPNGVDLVTVECNFEGGNTGSVEVHLAPPKPVARMREKILEYAYPHPKSKWPLSGNILDPIRLSIVCSGAAEILEIARWFTDSLGGSDALQVCRVKNGFAPWSDDDAPDGYRDLKLFVVYTGAANLRIIGEIQIHDRELYKLKLKMYKLYTIKRAQQLDAIWSK